MRKRKAARDEAAQRRTARAAERRREREEGSRRDRAEKARGRAGEPRKARAGHRDVTAGHRDAPARDVEAGGNPFLDDEPQDDLVGFGARR